MENKQLKGCPFCGGEAKIQEEELGSGIIAAYVLCENCGGRGKKITYRYLNEEHQEAYDAAAEAWNKRAVVITKTEKGKSSGFLMINPYREYVFRAPLESWFKAVEEALGFKLFFWQKTYIERGVFRCFGKTTAEILQDLSQYHKQPLDLRGYRRRNLQARVYGDELLRVKETLDAAGVPTREVWLTEADRRKWIQKREEAANTQVEGIPEEQLRPQGKFWDV